MNNNDIFYPKTKEECRKLIEWHVDNAWDTYKQKNETRDEKTIRKCVRQGTLGELMFSAINNGVFPVKLNRDRDHGIDSIHSLLGKIQLKTSSNNNYVIDDGWRKDNFPQADYCYLIVGFYDNVNDNFNFYYEKPSNVINKWHNKMFNDGKTRKVLDKKDLLPWISIDEAYKRYGKIQHIHPDNDLDI